MSNAEMPQIHVGQVWARKSGPDTETIAIVRANHEGPATTFDVFFGYPWPCLPILRPLSDEELRDLLTRDHARLINGPGAPWSPKDVQEPKTDASAEAEESIACPGCGHDAFEHANDSRIVGCEWSDGEGTICGCRWLLWEILRYAANKRRVEKHGEPFDDKYHEKMGFRG